MKFSKRRPPNPFDNPFIAMGLHLVVMVMMLAAGYLSIQHSSFWPLFIGFIVMTVLEAVWLYFKLRK